MTLCGALVSAAWWATRDDPLPPLSINPAPAPTFTPDIRVALTTRPVPKLTLAVDGPYLVRPVGGTRILGRGDRLAAAPVVTTATGLRIGRANYPVSRIEIVPERPPSIWIDEHQYRGTVRLFRRPNDTLIAVNALPLEDYVAAVVDAEMPAAFPEAARQAQAIVARTYALSQMQSAAGHPHFDLYSSTRSQKYLGFQYRTADGRRLAGETESARQAAGATAGMVCTWKGRLFCTYYSAVCGGRTTRGDQFFDDAAPPLQSVACDGCRDADRYRWTAEPPRTEVAAALRRHFAAQGAAFDKLVSIAPAGGGTEGLLAVFEVSDGRQRLRLSGAELRQRLPGALPSPHFTVHEAGDALVFEGRGHGHGAGLCQWGARGHALAGRTPLEIVTHYYPGAEIVVLRP